MPISVSLLKKLEDARTLPFPQPSRRSQEVKPIKRRSPGSPTHYGPAPIPPPLSFDLDVIEGPPTAKQLLEMKLVAQSPHPYATLFLETTKVSLSEHPTTAEQVVELAKKRPELLRWPIVVCWRKGVISIGGNSVPVIRLLRKMAEVRGIPKQGPPLFDPEVDKERARKMRESQQKKEEVRRAKQATLNPPRDAPPHSMSPGSSMEYQPRGSFNGRWGLRSGEPSRPAKRVAGT